jgi:MFS family permease
VVPLLAHQVFGLAAFTSALTFILAFGAVKAVTNFFAGALSDQYGRKPVLIAGWLAALPVPAMLIWAPSWGWVVAANVLLGINQGLTWSTTVIMKIDLVGPNRRGLAMGLNEAAGYGALSVTALATGYLATAYGLRPAPFLLGAAYLALGLGLSALAVRETHAHARIEAAHHATRPGQLHEHLTTRQVATLTSWREPALSAASQAGMVNNLNDALAWASSRSCTPSTASMSSTSARSPRCTSACGESGSWPPAHSRTGSAASGSSPRACGCRPPPLRWSPLAPRRRCG